MHLFVRFCILYLLLILKLPTSVGNFISLCIGLLLCPNFPSEWCPPCWAFDPTVDAPHDDPTVVSEPMVQLRDQLLVSKVFLTIWWSEGVLHCSSCNGGTTVYDWKSFCLRRTIMDELTLNEEIVVYKCELKFSHCLEKWRLSTL